MFTANEYVSADHTFVNFNSKGFNQYFTGHVELAVTLCTGTNCISS
jgi:hypothetical protein